MIDIWRSEAGQEATKWEEAQCLALGARATKSKDVGRTRTRTMEGKPHNFSPNEERTNRKQARQTRPQTCKIMRLTAACCCIASQLNC